MFNIAQEVGVYSIVFLVLACVLLRLNRNTRSRAWIFITLIVYVSTAVWGVFDPITHSYLNFTLDAIVCLIVYKVGREQWEMEIWRIYQLMGLTNMFCAFGLIQEIFVVSMVLEICNYLVLLVASTPLIESVMCHGSLDNRRSNDWSLRRIVHSLRAERKNDPWFTKT